MRSLVPVGAAASAAAMAFLLPSPAFASTAPGDNGTVKIHDARTGEELRKNEPHVCTFYLDAFGFDGGQQVTWKIVEWPPTGTQGKLADSGSITLDSAGQGRTSDQALADGHYKLTWNFDGENGYGKQKVFWVDCSAQGGGPGEPSGSASPSATSTTPAGTQPGTGGAAGSAAPSASPTSGGNLAETGSDLNVVLPGAALLLAAGGALTLVVRRRAAARH
jgi:hypothetical protein